MKRIFSNAIFAFISIFALALSACSHSDELPVPNDDSTQEVPGNPTSATVTVQAIYDAVEGEATKLYRPTVNVARMIVDGKEVAPSPAVDFNTTGKHTVTFMLSDMTTSINMFYDCKSLVSVNLSEKIRTIDEYAFYNCSKLESVTIPEGVTTIGSSAFRGCTGLKKIALPASLTQIGASAFQNCHALSYINSKAMTAPGIQDNTFASTCVEGVVHVPYGSSGYKEKWSSSLKHWSIGYEETISQLKQVLCSDGEIYSVKEYKEMDKSPVAVVFYEDESNLTDGIGYAVYLWDVRPAEFADSLDVKQNTSSSLEAYDGQTNTFQLYSGKVVTSPMAQRVYSLLPHGQQAFIPSVAEIRLLFEAKARVNPIIEECGGDPLPLEPVDCWYWTSTEVQGQETVSAWLYSLGSGIYLPTMKTQVHKIRPIVTIRN